jgi:hypothetical protein
MLRHAIALLVATAASLSSASATFASSPYDGRWSVVIETLKGDCDRAYRYGLNIANGNVSYAGDAPFDIRGRVAGNGAVHVRVSRGASFADGHGRLSPSDGSGSGTWHGVGNGVCSGKWFAERR